MSNTTFQPDPIRSSRATYVIRVKDHLAPSWSEAFEGMQLTLTSHGETLITGVVADQAALHGLLARIRDLNLTLISVVRVKPEGLSRSRTRRAKP
jgi:hypothetical protein